MKKDTPVVVTMDRARFQTLIELVDLGLWMANAHREKPIQKYEDAEQAFLACAKEAGFECVEYDEEMKMHFLDGRFEEVKLHPVRLEYDEYTFWEELVESLAGRDLIDEHGEDKLKAMSREEFYALKDARAAAYKDEFDERGVARLKLVE
jgi:hypothetical protein